MNTLPLQGSAENQTPVICNYITKHRTGPRDVGDSQVTLVISLECNTQKCLRWGYQTYMTNISINNKTVIVILANFAKIKMNILKIKMF